MYRERISKNAVKCAAAAAFSLFFPLTALAADKDIVILTTNDVHCGVDDNIGYAGLKLYEKEVEAETPYVLLADAGDAIQGAPIGTLSEGEYLVDIMDEMGYDFAIPGNHEFDYGMDRFLELSKELDCGYTSCNFVDLKTGETVFEPYRMFTFDDTDVALIGVTTPETFTKSSPKYFQDESGEYIYGFSEDDTGEALYEAVQSAADEARAEGAEYVILVGHLGNAGITEKWTSEAVIAGTSSIDAMIDGHSHEQYAKEFKNKEGKTVPVLQAGTKLQAIGQLTIGTDGYISTELIDNVTGDGVAESTYIVKRGDSLCRIADRLFGSQDFWSDIYNANMDIIEDPDLIMPDMELILPGGTAVNEAGKNVDEYMDAYIRGIEAEFDKELKTVIGHTEVELTTLDPDTEERRVRSGETNLGDLCADAVRIRTGADIGLMNGGGIRADIAKGDITYNDALSVFPYGNMICVAEVTGQQILDCLEMGVKNYPEESGGFQQVSGITFTVDTGIGSSVTTDTQRNFTGVAGKYRVRDVEVNGEPLDPEKTYTLASHNYLLKSGGDGMTMFDGAEIIGDEISADVDMLAAYIKEDLGGTVGAEYAEAEGQGRITIK